MGNQSIPVSPTFHSGGIDPAKRSGTSSLSHLLCGGAMTKLSGSKFRLKFSCCALLMSALFPVFALADNWQLQVGGQNGDRSHQALALLPNEIWIHSGERMTWSFAANEIGTATFLT